MIRRNITTEILKMALLAVAIPTVANILSQDKEFVLANLKLYTLAFLGMFVCLSGLMFLFSYILRRRNRSTILLQESVVRALEQALDQSLLNPHSSNKQNEQRTGKTSTKP